MPGPIKKGISLMPETDNQASQSTGLLRSAVGLFKSLNPFSATTSSASGVNLRLLDSGARVQDYIIDNSVGHDGLIATYHGRLSTSGQPVVIKEYLPSALSMREIDLSVVPDVDESGPEFFRGLERFLDEGEMLRHAQHPNVARVMDSFEANRTAYTVFERVEGETLDKRRARLGALDDRALMDLAIGALSGLEYLHTAGIVHGQINETSIVFTDENKPVIVFNDGAGLASLRKQLANASVGRRKNGRNEVIEVQPSADLFMLSLMLDRVGKAVSGGNRSDNVGRSSHDPELVALIGRALSTNVNERPASAGQWLEEFERLRDRAQDSFLGISALDERADTQEDVSELVAQEEDFHIGLEQRAEALPMESAKFSISDTVFESAPLADDPIHNEEDAESDAAALMSESTPWVEVELEESRKAHRTMIAGKQGADSGKTASSKQSSTTRVDTMGNQTDYATTNSTQFDPAIAAGAMSDNPAQLQQIASGLQQMLADREQMEQSHRHRIEELEARLTERTALLERSAVQLKQYDTAMKQSRVAIAERDDREKALRQRMEDLERKLSERTATAALAGDHEQVEKSLRKRISELESHVGEQSQQLEKSTEQLRQYEETLQQSNATTAGQSETEMGLRKRIEELERNLAEQSESVATMSAERQKLTSALGEQRRLLEETQRQAKEVQPLASGQQLQHATQSQLVELRKILAAEFARNAALVEVARQEAQGAEAARQRLIEQTELVLADYRSRNKKIRTQEEARIREERRLLEIEREFLRSSLDTANKAREHAETMASKAVEQANRLRTLTTTQIDAIESEVGSDLRKVRNALPWTPKGSEDDGGRALESDA
jgi:serine/threonine protein kinase